MRSSFSIAPWAPALTGRPAATLGKVPLLGQGKGQPPPFDAMGDPSLWYDMDIVRWLERYRETLESYPQCNIPVASLNIMEGYEWELLEAEVSHTALRTLDGDGIAAVKAWQECLGQDADAPDDPTTEDKPTSESPIGPVVVIGGVLALVVALVR